MAWTFVLQLWPGRLSSNKRIDDGPASNPHRRGVFVLERVGLARRRPKRVDELRQARKETVGLNRGLAGSSVSGLDKNPVRDERPTLASQGIDKNLAHQAAVLRVPNSSRVISRKRKGREAGQHSPSSLRFR
jgi:hypothetical protein